MSGKTVEKINEKIKAVLKQTVCDNCLGRQFAELLSGMTNEERGRVIRTYAAMLIDSGEKLDIDIDMSNFRAMKFRNVKSEEIKSSEPSEPKKCELCKNFFRDRIEELAKDIAKKLEDVEFENFLVGTIVSDDMGKAEERLWANAGIEFVEPIKSEINRELGKRVEKLTGKRFKLDNPDVTILADLGANRIRLQVKGLFIAGGYKKLVRNISQTKWVCSSCGGKGCKECEGMGKRYKTSVQEEIEKPLIKAAKAKSSRFHGAGREDVDARCLDYRPFVIELVRPMKRKISLSKMRVEINKSKKVNVSRLQFSDKDYVRKIKTMRYDKTYLAEVTFAKDIDRKDAKKIKYLVGQVEQETPTRVIHRRADKTRKRKVKSISVKLIGKRKLELKVRAESGLYIKELISGDGGRTKQNIADILGNKVKKINLDVIKIWKGKG